MSGTRIYEYKDNPDGFLNSLAKMFTDKGFKVFWCAEMTQQDKGKLGSGFMVERNGCTVSVWENGDIHIHRGTKPGLMTSIHDPKSMDLLEKYIL